MTLSYSNHIDTQEFMLTSVKRESNKTLYEVIEKAGYVPDEEIAVAQDSEAS